MHEKETIVFGVPVPSDDPVFLTLVVIHILLGLTCVVAGFIAMMSTKGKSGHTLWGKIYYVALLLIFLTVVPLSLMRWPSNNHLLVLGTLSFGLAYYGKRLAKKQNRRWTRTHTICMGMSYVLLLTAFYVDNGKNLPLWNLLPQYAFWILPTAIGVPIILYALSRHPLNAKV